MTVREPRSEDDLRVARDLFQQGEQRRALKALQRARRSALEERRLDLLEQVLEVAVRLRDETGGKLQYASGSLVHSTVQNIRFLTRQLALERGEVWIDPTVQTPAPVPAPAVASPPPAAEVLVRAAPSYPPPPEVPAPGVPSYPAAPDVPARTAETASVEAEEVVARLDRLEQEVARLRAELAALPGLVAVVQASSAPGTAGTEPPSAAGAQARAPAPAPAPTPAPTTPAPVAHPHAPYAPAAPVPRPDSATPMEAPVRPPAPPPPPRRTLGELARDWDLVGARGFAIAGGAVMALGIGFFFVLAANRGWIGEGARVLLGATASTIVLAAGIVLRARYGQYWSALAAVGAGIAGAYATLAAASARYDLVPDALALPLAGVIAAVGTVIAVRWGSQTIAAIGLLGAALAPALQALDRELTWVSAAFAAIVLVAAAAVSVPRGWRELLLSSSALVGVQLQWLVTDAGSPAGVGTVVVASVFALTLLGVAVGLQSVRRLPDLDELGLGYATAAFAIALMWSIQLFGERSDRGIVLLGAAAVWALVCAALVWRREPDLGAVVGASALALAAVGTGDLLTDAALTVAWAAEALVLAAAARRLGDARLQATSYVYAALSAASAFATTAHPASLFDEGADQLVAVAPLASAAVAAVGAGLLAPPSYRARTETGILAFVRDLRAWLDDHRRGVRETLGFAGGVLATLAAAYLAVSVSFEWGHVLASVVAAAAGASFLAVAGRRRASNLAAASYAWLAVVLVEVLAFDVGEFSDVANDLSRGGWSVLAASAGVLGGAYAHRLEHRERAGRDWLLGVAAGLAAASAFLGVGLLTDSHWLGGLGLLLVALVYGALSAAVFSDDDSRNASTILWSFGLLFLVAAESVLVTDSVWRAAGLAATAIVVGALARPLAESRLWLAGGSLVVVTSAAVVLALAQPWVAEGEAELRAAIASAACAAAAFGLAALVWRDERRRDLRTVVWAVGLVTLLATERVALDDWRATAFLVAVTGGALALFARPLGEYRLWVAGAIVVGVTTLATFALVTPPSHFFVASASPASALWVLVGCIAAAAAVAVSAASERDRVVLEAVTGGLALYAVSLGILDIAERISTASIATDFERGHTAVSGLWALIGLGLLVAGLLRGSAAIRYGGLVLFGVSVAKIFLYDLSELSSIARAFSFILVGGLLLAGGFFLQRLSDRMGPRTPRHP